jgi:hypothetical protein
MSPKSEGLRLTLPEGVLTEDALTALGVARLALEKSQHGEGEPLSPNPASRHLMSFVEESYEIMAASLAKEVAKVLSEGEPDKGR